MNEVGVFSNVTQDESFLVYISRNIFLYLLT